MKLAGLRDTILSLYRIVIGFVFFCHGVSTLFGNVGGVLGGRHTAPVGQWPGWWAGLIQVVCGALVVLGLGTRPAAFLASGSMAYAYFTVHQEHALLPIGNGGEMPVLFCWGFLLLVMFGAGPLSLDRLVSRMRRRNAGGAAESERSGADPVAGTA